MAAPEQLDQVGLARGALGQHHQIEAGDAARPHVGEQGAFGWSRRHDENRRTPANPQDGTIGELVSSICDTNRNRKRRNEYRSDNKEADTAQSLV